MDELAVLIEKLKGEGAALEAALATREADEATQLNAQEARLGDAEARLAKARALLSADSATLTVLDERRTQLLKRIESWRGDLFRLGHGGAVMALVVTALMPLPVVGSWLGVAWSLGFAATQVGLFACAFFLIPEKR